jgi:hypothetical protein
MTTKTSKVLCHFCRKQFVDIRMHYKKNAECNRQNEMAQAEAAKLRKLLEAEATKNEQANDNSNQEQACDKDNVLFSNKDECGSPASAPCFIDPPDSNSDESSSLAAYMEEVTQSDYFKHLQEMLDQQQTLDSSRQSDYTMTRDKELHEEPVHHDNHQYPSTINVDFNSNFDNDVPPLSNTGPYDGGVEIGLPGRDPNMFPDHNPPSPIDPGQPPEDVPKKRKYSLVDGNHTNFFPFSEFSDLNTDQDLMRYRNGVEQTKGNFNPKQADTQESSVQDTSSNETEESSSDSSEDSVSENYYSSLCQPER